VKHRSAYETRHDLVRVGPSKPGRRTRAGWRAASLLLGAWLATAAPAGGEAATPAKTVQASRAPDLTGAYWATEYHARIEPIGGRVPPLNAAGEAAYAKNRAGMRDKSIDDSVRSLCLPDAVPRLLSTPYPFQVYQAAPGQVTFVHELNNQVRDVPLAPQPASDDEALNLPSYEGYATAHYEGDVLVIRATGFNDQTFLDSSGLPHSDQLVTTERIRRIGDTLEDVVTIHDPVLYAGDWRARFVYRRRPGLRLEEYVCGEPHRDISMVKGIPEVREQRARGQFP
jgi:hypothetical protein